MKAPEKFYITPTSKTIAVGIEDKYYTHFIDESIYKVEWLQEIITNNKTDFVFDTKILPSRPCRLDDF